MNREDVLKKSQEENQQKDLYELEVGIKASNIAAIAMAALCLVFMYIGNYMDDGGYRGYCAVIFIFSAVVSIYKAIKLKKKKYIISSVFWSIFTIVGIVYHIKYLLG